VPRPPAPTDSGTTRDETTSLHAASDFSGPVPVYDLSTLAELEGVFGHARLMELLGHLKDEIAQRLLAPSINRSALRNDAHALLSVSGSLGFFELSRRCIEMEQACRLGADLAAPLSAARAAASGAIAAIEDLIARVIELPPAICAA